MTLTSTCTQKKMIHLKFSFLPFSHFCLEKNSIVFSKYGHLSIDGSDLWQRLLYDDRFIFVRFPVDSKTFPFPMWTLIYNESYIIHTLINFPSPMSTSIHTVVIGNWRELRVIRNWKKEFGNWLKIGCLCNECPISGTVNDNRQFHKFDIKKTRIELHLIK